MLAIHLDELSQDDREHLRTEIVALLLTEMSYPPYLDYYAGVLRSRPPSNEVKQHAAAFVAGLSHDAEHVDINTSAFTNYITDLLLRYQNTVVPARRDLQRRCLPAHLIAPVLAQKLQQRLVAVVMHNEPDHFGAPAATMSWKKNLNAAPLASPWEAIADDTVALAQAIAELREEAQPKIPRPVVPTVSDMATMVIPVVEKVQSLPEPSSYLPTAPLPQPTQAPAPASSKSRNDRVIFQQLREQLMQAMQNAGRSYGLATIPDDPAGLLALLRQHNSVDEGDLRLAEGILALCSRIISEDRADIDDYRQAMTLYLLFHRGRFGH